MTKGSQLVARGDDGLMDDQRRYIQKYAETGSEAQAQENLDFPRRRVRNWHNNDQAFRTAFNTVVEGIHEGVVQRLKVVEEKLPDAIEELLSATKSVRVECPKCKLKFSVDIDNTAIQAKMVDMLMKSQGHLKEVTRHEVGVDEEVLSSALRMALSMVQKGAQIGVDSAQELIRRGKIEETSVEGEYRILEE
ncbi:hypothetical protein LCGC14_0735350 [marine sediment metagenome]|uniref:Uncharacterized protein n=1 Tax=marine sediment metagenome TaxID=412755 RepID=A0A0F9Q8D6_9ZZZZ